MISDRDFIVLSDNWNGLPTSAVHLFGQLAKQNRIFWFNTIGRLPRPNLADARKVFQTLRPWLARPERRQSLQPAGHGVCVMNPFMVPWFKPLVRRFNRASFLRKYKALAEHHKIARPVVVTTLPINTDFVAAIPNALKIYYCVDDFLEYPGVNHADWAALESELVRSIDALVITCETLAQKRAGGYPLLHLPHGVDFDHFQTAIRDSRPEPRMESLRRPVVGFFGLLGQWVDLSIVAKLSRKFPHCSFVLLGRTETNLRPLAGCPNVHCLGWVSYQELPRFARYFDIGLIPFTLNRLTRAVNPLKLMEYFALGLPVLSTRLPALEGLPGPLRLAYDFDDFCAGLSDILQKGPRTFFEEAIACARSSTWEARAVQFGDFIRALETRRSSQHCGARLLPETPLHLCSLSQ